MMLDGRKKTVGKVHFVTIVSGRIVLLDKVSESSSLHIRLTSGNMTVPRIPRKPRTPPGSTTNAQPMKVQEAPK